MDRKRAVRFAGLAIKMLVAVLVVGFVGRHVARTWRDLHAEGRSIRIDPAWAAASVGLYVAGLTLCGAFYGRVLKNVPPGIGSIAAIRAYLISHLGKYVPGKAVVVVVRVALTTPFGPRAASATFATFYETLVMMAAGGAVAAIGFASTAPVLIEIPIGDRPVFSIPPFLFGLIPAVGFLAIVSPAVFPRLASLAKKPFRGLGPEILPPTGWPILVEGLAWTAGAWVLMGLSQVAILNALIPGGVDPRLWPAVIASVALATVAGFVVAVAPGGLGVRELVLWTALGTAVDRDVAVVAALALRLSWVAGEVVGAAALAWIRPRTIGGGSS